MLQTFFIILLSAISIFIVLLVLIQRGKGGGLAGAFGGMGGQSAFGTKAGDAFTKITVVTAVLWFCLCIWAVLALRGGGSGLSQHLRSENASGTQQTTEGGTMSAPTAPATSTGTTTPAE